MPESEWSTSLFSCCDFGCISCVEQYALATSEPSSYCPSSLGCLSLYCLGCCCSSATGCCQGWINSTKRQHDKEYVMFQDYTDCCDFNKWLYCLIGIPCIAWTDNLDSKEGDACLGCATGAALFNALCLCGLCQNRNTIAKATGVYNKDTNSCWSCCDCILGSCCGSRGCTQQIQQLKHVPADARARTIKPMPYVGPYTGLLVSEPPANTNSQQSSV